jgi:hypothetical protein
MHLFSPQYLLHTPPILFLLTLSPEYLVTNTEYKASPYIVFSTPVTSSILGPNTFLSTLFSYTLSLSSSLTVKDQVSQHKEKYILLCMLNFMFLSIRQESKSFWTERWTEFLQLKLFLISSWKQTIFVMVMPYRLVEICSLGEYLECLPYCTTSYPKTQQSSLN